MINCFIVDDEQAAIEILKHYIGQVPFLQLAGSTTNPVEALQAATSGSVDLFFLDIQMPELTGLDFIRAIGGKSMVILTTAYSEYALEGYELDVVDYLLKPIRFPRFLAAVQKAAKSLNREGGEESAGENAEEGFIFVKTETKGKLLKIELAEIEYIEGMKNYVAVHHAGKKTLVYTAMKDLEDKLPARDFLRVHKSFIIPLARITGIEGNRILIKGVTAEILIGESYKPLLMDRIRNNTIN